MTTNFKNDIIMAMENRFKLVEAIHEFYVISSNPKKWVGHYGMVGFASKGKAKPCFISSGSKERIAARILNFSNNIVHEFINGLYLIFAFDGDWKEVDSGLWYSESLNNYYYTGCSFEYPIWFNKNQSNSIFSYLEETGCWESLQSYYRWLDEIEASQEPNEE